MISPKKVAMEKAEVVRNCKKCGGKGCPVCFGYASYMDRMAEAEVPVDYWRRNIKDFYGDQNFGTYVQKYTKNLKKAYLDGVSLCFVGHPGTGKTFAACSILKQAVLPNVGSPDYFSAYYTTMVDAVTKLMSPRGYGFRELLKNYDFLVIDELDPRFFPSENSKDLYGNHLENILRTRVQNKLPTIMCTNSEDVTQIFSGEFGRTFESLISQFVRVLRAGGRDARKREEKV